LGIAHQINCKEIGPPGILMSVMMIARQTSHWGDIRPPQWWLGSHCCAFALLHIAHTPRN